MDYSYYDVIHYYKVGDKNNVITRGMTTEQNAVLDYTKHHYDSVHYIS